MSRRLRIVGAIVAKDLTAFTRDRFFAFMTILGLVAYVVIYWLLPTGVDETIRIGVHHTGLDAFVASLDETEGIGLDVVAFPSDDELAAAVEAGEGDIAAGIAFPGDFLDATAAGRQTTVRVYVRADVPPEIRTAMTALVRELAFAAAGEQPPVRQPSQQEVVVGTDRAGDQISLQEQMRPMFAFFILLVETFALATLVASEIQSRTVVAVLATPARTSDFLAAKTVVGTLLAFAEVVLLMALMRAFGTQPGVLLVTLLMGAILVTGFGLMAGSTGRDFIGIIFWSMLFMVPLAIPAVAALFPGTAAGWVEVLPTAGLVDAILRASAYGDGWAAVGRDLVTLGAWCIAVLVAGWVVLKRRVEAL